MYLLKDEFFLSPHKAHKQEKETKSKHNQINILFAELNLEIDLQTYGIFENILLILFRSFEISPDIIFMYFAFAILENIIILNNIMNNIIFEKYT